VLDKLKAVEEKERQMLANIRTGRLIPDWLESVLASKGCEIVGGE
jgi:hypothetical protein